MLGFKNKTSETADAEKDAAKKNPKPKRSRFVKLLTIFAVAALVVQEAYRDLNLAKGVLPIAEDISATELSIPMYYGMTDEEVNYIIDALNAFK